ncbi:MAG TPA: hypothetical protein VGU63_07540 [Candidatus Acidoferrales bacterium]|nr:hypothetical protein [Candidatus Acidoferrales bacterium]
MSETQTLLPPRAVIPLCDGFLRAPEMISDLQEVADRAHVRALREYGEYLRREKPFEWEVWKQRQHEPLRADPEDEHVYENPAWEKFGFRGATAKLLFECGLERVAVRFVNCGVLGRPGACSRYPFEHKFYLKHGCGVRFCKECGQQERVRLTADYTHVISAVVAKYCPDGRLPKGWTLARLNLTLRSDGSAITPERVRKMNKAAKFAVRKSVGKRAGYGLLFCDEVGFETRGHIAKRTAGGLNLHLHGLYFGPYLDYEKTRDLWMAETLKCFGVESRGCWIKAVKVKNGDLQGAIRHALNHLLKYVSKPPAVTAGRLASLIAAFNKTRRVHVLGLFYGKKPKREKQDCPCPKCKDENRHSGVGDDAAIGVVCFEKNGRIPRVARVEELRANGYVDLRESGRAMVLNMGSGDSS